VETGFVLEVNLLCHAALTTIAVTVDGALVFPLSISSNISNTSSNLLGLMLVASASAATGAASAVRAWFKLIEYVPISF
jgi:hypothetical protein